MVRALHLLLKRTSRFGYRTAKTSSESRRPYYHWLFALPLTLGGILQRTLLISAVSLALAAQMVAASSIYDYQLSTIDYENVPLRDFKGKVLMIVNVASRCGYTPQYAGLEKLYRAHKDQGFVIVGIPSDDFGQGEPGSDPEIKQFCRRRYDVTFPMMSKTFIRANPRLPLYEYLTDERQNPKTGGEIQWNFTKFLIGRDGTILARFEPAVTPEDPSLVKAVENALR
ncbi:MAG TPA: glutathione peroxidase [Bryobacteraceae bacterium]|nr:glutathione peroxidase [Bryobacteraceae bacterium]